MIARKFVTEFVNLAKYVTLSLLSLFSKAWYAIFVHDCLVRVR